MWGFPVKYWRALRMYFSPLLQCWSGCFQFKWQKSNSKSFSEEENLSVGFIEMSSTIRHDWIPGGTQVSWHLSRVLSSELALLSGSEWWFQQLQTLSSLLLAVSLERKCLFPTCVGRCLGIIPVGKLDQVSKRIAVAVNKGVSYADWLNQVTCSSPTVR